MSRKEDEGQTKERTGDSERMTGKHRGEEHLRRAAGN